DVVGDDMNKVRLAGRPLSPDEQLVLALKGEGIFTETQMAHMIPTRTDVFSSEQLEAMAIKPPGSSPHRMPPVRRYHDSGIVVAHSGAIITPEQFNANPGSYGIGQA